jgi:RND family efflux transporter MFP subunit
MAKKVLALLVGAGLLVFLGFRVYDAQQLQSAPKAGKKGGARTVSVDIVEATIGDVREELLLTGSLKPKETVDITPKATGRVQRLYFQIGDTMRVGDLVAELDDDELQQQVNRAEATIEVSRATLMQREAERDNANAELARADSLLKEQLIAPQDYEARRTGSAVVNAQVALARAQMEQAEAELRELKIRVAQAKIYAPMTGIAATRYVDVGALVSPSTPILRMVNLATLVTQANVPERSLGRMRVGNQAQVFVDAIPDREFHGRIARIAPVLDAATRTAFVEIDIPNPEGFLKAEMFVRVQLDLGTTRQATLIPREGLVYRGQQPGVYIIEGNTPTFRAIETGLTREDQVEVLANLTAGTKIAGRGASMIQEGDRIATRQPQTPARTAESPAPAEKPAADVSGRPQTVNRQASAGPQTASYSSPGR